MRSRRFLGWVREKKRGLAVGAAALFVLALGLITSGPPAVAGRSSLPKDPTPLLAYYYIWFDPTSWDRAKMDYPLLGRYSSDDVNVMRQHIQWAKEAGINGFIVSWKSTDALDARLAKLVQVAAAENFKLAIIYEGLDFNRNPLPADKVAADLDYFIQHYGTNPVFDLYGKPLVIWSGTWKFSRADVQKVTTPRRSSLLILASEKNVKGYERLADLVDGDAYYWSSVNPDTFTGYASKLNAMADAIHSHQGLWIAPAAPGFDARLVGGTSVLDRQNGTVLRQEMNTAMQSSPDAIGLISWNEFSENSYVEPSQKYGDLYLRVLADIRNTPPPVIPSFDSSDPGPIGPAGTNPWPLAQAAALGLIALVLGVSLVALVRRRTANTESKLPNVRSSNP